MPSRRLVPSVVAWISIVAQTVGKTTPIRGSHHRGWEFGHLPLAPAPRVFPQYSIWQVIGVWALAAFPIGALAWVVAPVVADRLSGEGNVPMVKALLVCLTVGLIWQFVLVVALVGHEQRSLRWSTLRDALWLHSPRSLRSGRVGGSVWLVLIPLIVAFAAVALIPSLLHPVNRDLGAFLGSDAGQSFLSGN
jgi:uncharacterized protein